MISVEKGDIVIYGCRKGRVLTVSGDECVVVHKVPGALCTEKVLIEDIHEVLLPADHVFDSSNDHIDWSKVAIDTPVYVRSYETSE